MDEEFRIVSVDEPAWSVIGGGISEYNRQQAGEDDAQTLCYVVQGADQEILGGAIGATYWEWLHLDLMWVKEEYRGRGIGRSLLRAAEDEARRRGAKRAYLDTFSFQAPGFYEKYGYQVFGELADFPQGHRRYFLTKVL
jgi:GNAT superfamily N-acetyltransferase